MSKEGLTFANEGAFNVNTPTGVFKILVLPPDKTDSDAFAVARFVAANMIHSGGDVLCFSHEPYLGSKMYYPNLMYKLFHTDQPLRLNCGHVAMVLCILLHNTGFAVRQTMLSSHVSVEVRLSDGAWIMIDPDFDSVVRDTDTGKLLGCEELLAILNQNGESRLAVEPLSGKHWVPYHRPWGFYGSLSWKADDRTHRCSTSLLPAIKGMGISMRRQISRIDSGVVTFDAPREVPPQLQPNTTIPIASQVDLVRAHIGRNAELRGIYDRVLSRLDAHANQELVYKYNSNIGFSGEPKYLDCAYWLWHKAQMAVTLGLQNRKGLRVLDLGTGAGHFCAVVNSLGHHAVGLDVPNELYEDLGRLLEVERVVASVERGRPLPDFPGRFDLITAFAIVFDSLPGGRFWSKDDWRWFLNHMIDRHLTPTGRLYFVPNSYRDEHGQQQRKDWIVDVFEEFGGTVHSNAVVLDLAARRSPAASLAAAAPG